MTNDTKLDIIISNVKKSSEKFGRCLDDIKILAVTKTILPERILPVLEYGFKYIGENYVQELLQKYDLLKNHVEEFHFIGHLQTNKVKYIIDKADLIHSVDSISLIKEISKQAKKVNKIQDILIEVNLTKEESKFGVYEENLYELLSEAGNYPNVLIKGLMTMPPLFYSEDDTRKIFAKLRKIFLDISNNAINNNIDMKYLSMGMSKDYMTAIEEGANIIRLGTTIFGQRESKI